jgi:hypothetical protein
MVDSRPPSRFNPNDPVLDQLLRQIRVADADVGASDSNALEAALKAGTAIIEALNREVTMVWICKHCGLKTSTAYLYKQLAERSTEIAAEREKNPRLSIREARKQFTKPARSGAAVKSVPIVTTISEPSDTDLIAARNAAEHWSDTAWKQALTKLSFERFLKVMPTAWRPQLEVSAAGHALDILKKLHPDLRLKRLKPAHLQLVHDAAETLTTH